MHPAPRPTVLRAHLTRRSSMIELVIPESLLGADVLDDDRLSAVRTMVGRRVFAVEGTLEDAQRLANAVSEAGREPVIVNDVTDRTEETRVVDVYMHQAGRQQSVSKGVERPRTEAR